jgi:glutathione S-transferase
MFAAMDTTKRFTLYSGPLSMFGAKVQIAALEKGLDFDLVLVPFDFTTLYTPKHPEVLRINPKRQVPVLVHGDLEIFDSTQIFEYLEDLQPTPALWPADVRERARARLLEHQSDEVYFPHVVRLMGLEHDLQGEAAQAAIEACRHYYAAMEAQLEGRDYLAGAYTFADIAFYMAAHGAVPASHLLSCGSMRGGAQSTCAERRRRALAMTLTDDRAIAAAATTGDSSRPKKG